MINELSRLWEAIQKAKIETEFWHQDYKLIPKDPCVKILLSNGKVVELDSIDEETRKHIRKFGNNQGTFPAMNLVPLYQIGDASIRKEIDNLIDNEGKGSKIEEIKTWCKQSNQKFKTGYKTKMCEKPSDIMKKTGGNFEPLNILINSTKIFSENPEKLHRQLREIAFSMIDEGENVKLALQVLFDTSTKNNGNLSVIFDCKELESIKFSSTSPKFTRGVNQALLAIAKQEIAAQSKKDDIPRDAFGLPYTGINKKIKMPEIKLGAGFDIKLRTMFEEQPSQYRYGLIEADSYHLSETKRMDCKTALEWLSQKSNENKTWVTVGDKDEVLFAYPVQIPQADSDFDFQQSDPEEAKEENKEAEFIASAENLIDFITKTKKPDPDNYPDYIQLFALHKYDKARTRVVYSRCTTPATLIAQSEQWRLAAENLPPLSSRMKQPVILPPIKIAEVMNRVWNRSGNQTGEVQRTGKYHGIDLLFGVSPAILRSDLCKLIKNAENMAAYASTALRSNEKNKLSANDIKQMRSLLGMFLYWLGIRKDDYMNNYPYLLGQLLKISDAIHELYCNKVRNEQIPRQLAGSSLYCSASERPLQTLAQLATRMHPYISWCKANKKEAYQGPPAYYYLNLYEKTADKLKLAFSEQTNFTDAEKAQLFIGYLAAFEKTKTTNTNMEQVKGE